MPVFCSQVCMCVLVSVCDCVCLCVVVIDWFKSITAVYLKASHVLFETHAAIRSSPAICMSV